MYLELQVESASNPRTKNCAHTLTLSLMASVLLMTAVTMLFSSQNVCFWGVLNLDNLLSSWQGLDIVLSVKFSSL